MPFCPLCESELPEGRTLCPACGQPLNRPAEAGGTPEQVRKALEAARRDILSARNARVDVTFARALVERAEQTEATGDVARALALARGARRAVGIARRKARVAEALAKAEQVLQAAREAGIETLTFQRTIEQARALAEAGQPAEAERRLRRLSIRALDQRRERVLQGILQKAEARIGYARERGASTADAEALLAEAREALALRAYGRVRPLCGKAVEKAEVARRYARAEAVLERAVLEVDEARRAGVNVTEARKILTQARDALRRNLYATVQELAVRSRQALREARRFALAHAALRKAEREVARERRRGADTARAEAVLAEAERALQGKEYAKVRSLAEQAHDATLEASRLKHLREALESLTLDAADLRALGADATEFESALAELRTAVDAGDLATARRLVAHARHLGESAREAHYRTVREESLRVVLANASRGLDPEDARRLLREVEEAVSLGKPVDLRGLIEARLARGDAELEARLNQRVLEARDEIVRLRQAGIDTVAMEGKLADAAIAISEKRYLNADGLLDAVEHDFHSLRETLRSEAAELLGRARGEIDHSRAGNIPLDPPVLTMLTEAEAAYSESRYGDAIYITKACISEIQRITQETLAARAMSEEEKARQRAQRVEAIERRLAAVRAEIDALVVQRIELQHALESLARAEGALRQGSLDEAEQHVAAAEGIVKGVKIALKQQASEGLERARRLLAEARGQGLATADMEAALARAERAFLEEQHVTVLEEVASLERAVERRRQERQEEEQRRAFEKTRAAASKFVKVKRLIEELRKAEIEVTGAEEGLRAAERALEEKAFEDVDAILADLDATAKELMEELVGAAQAMRVRAERAIEEGRSKGLDVTEAASLLAKAEEHFGRGEYAEAAESARAAEKRIQEDLQALEARRQEERRKAQEAARAEIASLRKVIADLGRADISIVHADVALARAQEAFDAGRYEDVPKELTEVKEMARGLTLGLEAAARDLVRVAERRVAEVRSGGVSPGRAEMVLLNAQEAIEDGRYVEAIEYKKVIEDILSDALKRRTEQALRDELEELRARIEAREKLGADMRVSRGLLGRAEERLRAGDLEGLEVSAKLTAESIESAQRAHLDGLVASLGLLVEEGVGLGLSRVELEECRQHAAEAALAADLEEVYRIKGDLQERILEAKRQALLRRSYNEVQTLEDQLVQSERLGIPIGETRAHLDQARRAVEAGDVEGFQQGLARSRAALEESRTKHFLERYEGRLHAASATIANAKRLGAEMREAERSLEQAEEALRARDLTLADVLIKQAEVAVEIEIANFIKNRYPNLVLHLPAKGLQANVWNRYVFEVENRGKLPARNVEFAFEGEVETKGATPIPELGVGERRLVEVGLRPKASGEVPVAVGVSYQRMFDENRYELKDKQSLRVAEEGTYLVEDVFLIHSDGRLISHQSRKFREEIDEDIFSGMLTVVQDFIKDSFRQRSHVGIKRLDFGDSKILIERSPHAFLACVVLGQEPRLLPLYILQVLKEVEDRYGHRLENWTGLLNELAGVDEMIRKLLLVAEEPTADMGPLSESPITLTAKVIEALGTAQTIEANELLAKAQSTLETDIQLAWQFIERARAQAEAAQSQLGERMAEMLAAARDTVQEMRAIGADISQAELLLREAEEAVQEKKFDRVREIQQSLHESLERAKGELSAKRVEIELASLINDIQIAKSQNLDVREAESYLTKIEAAIQRKNYRQMDEFLRRAKESLARQRRHAVLSRAREDLAKIRATLAEAKEVHADLGDVEVLLAKAEAALQAEDLKDLEPLIHRAEATMKARVEQVLKDRYPRLFLETSHVGLQANRWNRFELRIENKGDWPAKDVVPVVNGPADVDGLRAIGRINPSQKVSVEFGLRPKETGTMDLDFEVRYTRPLDEAKHEVTESTAIRVEEEGTYAVEDAILVHGNGTLICHESRGYLHPEERSKASALEASAKAFVAKAFGTPDAKAIQRATLGEANVIALRGPLAHLVVGLRGQEPKVLALYALQVLQEVHETFGHRLEGWSGDLDALPGIREVVRKVLFATDTPGVSLGPLEESPVSKISLLEERGLLGGRTAEEFLEEARAAIEEKGYDEGARILKNARDALAGPTEEISRQIQSAVLASKEAGTLQITDDQVAIYVDVLRRALEAAFRAKARAGIERYWPVARLAIKAKDPLGYDAINAFRKIIVSQSGAKELDIVAPNETWRGMKVSIDIHMDSVSAAYKLWAKKIEILLRSQDAWKIKAGLEKGEYSVGIEGQKVRIDPTMVSFVESVPEYVIEEPFEGGVLYLDTRMTKDLLAEGYAKEIVNIVRESRREMDLSEDSVVEVDILASQELRAMLRPWRDMIQREANALEVRFSPEAPEDAYVVEAILGEEKLYLGIRPARM